MLAFHPLTKILKGSTVVKTFETVERGVFMDYNYSVLRKARNSRKVCIKGERGEEEDRYSERKRQWYKFQSFM